MKKLSLVLVFFFTLTFLNAVEYKIENINYNLQPSSWDFLPVTKQYALEQQVVVDYNKVFASQEELDKYVQDYEARLKNTRAFEEIQIKTEYGKAAS